MNTEDFVTYEQAFALRKLGFREKCLYYYDEYGDIFANCEYSNQEILVDDLLYSYNRKNYENILCDAPTLAQAQAWLRNEKKISVEPWSCYTGGWNCTIKILPEEINYNITSKPSDNWLDIDKDYNSYEEALSDGITECFKCLEND